MYQPSSTPFGAPTPSPGFGGFGFGSSASAGGGSSLLTPQSTPFASTLGSSATPVAGASGAAPGGFSFGAPSSAVGFTPMQPSQPAFPQQQQQQPASLFGVRPAATPGSSLFGAPSGGAGNGFAPGSSFGAPGSSFGAPGSSFGAPGSSFGAPGSSFGAPGSSFGTGTGTGALSFGTGTAGSSFGSGAIGSSFGAGTAGSLLGSGPSFGTGNALGTTPGIFGGSTAYGSARPAAPAAGAGTPAPAPAAMHFRPEAEPSVEEALRLLVARVTPMSEVYGLVHMFYNLQDGRLLAQYGPRPEWRIAAPVWEQAVAENPDPSRLTPVPAFGFSDLRKRLEWVARGTEDHAAAVREQQKRLNDILRLHELTVQEGIDARAADLRRLVGRVLALVGRMEVLKCSGYQLSLDEERFRQKLARMLDDLNNPTQYKGRLDELRSVVDMQDPEKEAAPPVAVDGAAVEHISAFLRKQQEGLEILSRQLQEDAEVFTLLRTYLED